MNGLLVPISSLGEKKTEATVRQPQLSQLSVSARKQVGVGKERRGSIKEPEYTRSEVKTSNTDNVSSKYQKVTNTEEVPTVSASTQTTQTARPSTQKSSNTTSKQIVRNRNTTKFKPNSERMITRLKYPG